jgi:hypothetical protein
MKRLLSFLAAPLAIGALAVGCTQDASLGNEDDALSSKTATFIELGFEGEVIATHGDSDVQRRKAIVSQLFYLSGEIDKTHGGHGQFGFAQLTNMKVDSFAEGLDRIRYRAVVPVAWPRSREVPASFKVVLPLRVDEQGLRDFNAKYARKCGEAHYGEEHFWYDFKPVTTACAMGAGDIVSATAKVARSSQITTDRRPEQEQFWKDGVFRMVIVHGTDGASSLDASDTGVEQYLAFQNRLKAAFPLGIASKGEKNGDIYDEWRFDAAVPKLGGGQGKLVVVMLLAGELKYAGSAFDARYDALSADADVITYGGHSGLGKNIRALAAKGKVTKGHYQVLFLDGCSTFAYLDDTLVKRRIEANGSTADPNGTKFLDVILNAQPSPWYASASNLMHLVKTLGGNKRKGYGDILDGISTAGMPVVTGENDNPKL